MKSGDVSKTGHSFFVHVCDLDFDASDAGKPFPSRRTHWWQRFDPYKTVHKTTTTTTYFRSHRAFVKEIRRHLDNPNYRLTIHPLSKIAFYEDLAMMVVWTMLMIFGPLQASFLFDRHNPMAQEAMPGNTWFWMKDMLRLFCALVGVDVVLRFFRGYIETKTQEMVLDRKRIRSYYLKTFFFFDVMMPLGWVVSAVTHAMYKDELTLLWVYQLRYLVTLRAGTALDTMDTVLRRFHFKENFRTCYRLVMAGFLAVHWWSCILKLITLIYVKYNPARLQNSWYLKYQDEMEVLALGKNQAFAGVVRLEIVRDYLTHYSVVGCYYLGVEMGRYYSVDSIEEFIFALVLISGMLFYITAAARILDFFGEMNISARKYEELLLQANQYATRIGIQQDLRHRICKYYNYKYDKNFFHEDVIMNGLSEHLRMEVILYSSLHLVDKLKIFKGLSKAAIGTVLAFLKQEIYLPNDTIMRRDQPQERFYFIIYGTCMVQLLDGTEVIHAEDGDLMSNAWNSISGTQVDFLYKVVAAEPCQIYVMEISDMRYCCTRYPALLERLIVMGQKGAKMFSMLYTAAITHDKESYSAEILEELHRKRILQHARLRHESAPLSAPHH